jgi:hypothetical protein
MRLMGDTYSPDDPGIEHSAAIRGLYEEIYSEAAAAFKPLLRALSQERARQERAAWCQNCEKACQGQ